MTTTAITYSYRHGFTWKVPPTVAGPFIEELRARTVGGQLPQAVVEAARPASSPIHNAFDWDDESAGEKFRLSQARSLIRSIQIERPATRPAQGRPVQVAPAFERVNVDGRVDYRSRLVVMSQKDTRLQIVMRGLKEFESLCAKYEEHPEIPVAEIRAAIQEATRRIATLRDATQGRATPRTAPAVPRSVA